MSTWLIGIYLRAVQTQELRSLKSLPSLRKGTILTEMFTRQILENLKSTTVKITYIPKKYPTSFNRSVKILVGMVIRGLLKPGGGGGGVSIFEGKKVLVVSRTLSGTPCRSSSRVNSKERETAKRRTNREYTRQKSGKTQKGFAEGQIRADEPKS